jgi:hypothetical protein
MTIRTGDLLPIQVITRGMVNKGFLDASDAEAAGRGPGSGGRAGDRPLGSTEGIGRGGVSIA